MTNLEIFNEYKEGKIDTLYILGMAKSFLDLAGAKKEKLELDFLKILYAIKARKENEQVIGYMAVVKSDVDLEAKIESWKSKYSTSPVPIKVFSLDDKEKIEQLKREKNKNKVGINKNSKEYSEAKEGKEILERFLKKSIEDELKITIQNRKEDKLFEIEWDYYLKLENKKL